MQALVHNIPKTSDISAYILSLFDRRHRSFPKAGLLPTKGLVSNQQVPRYEEAQALGLHDSPCEYNAQSSGALASAAFVC